MARQRQPVRQLTRGNGLVKAGGFLLNYSGLFEHNGFPSSGTAGTMAGQAGVNALLVDRSSGVVFVNEGTAASPDWTPVSFDQRGLLGWYSDFRGGVGKALADTAASATLDGSGLRIHGQGIAEIDSGLVVDFAATDGKGAVATLTTTDEDAHAAVLSVGTGTVPVFQPDQHGVMVIDAIIAAKTALTAKAVFVGFSGLGTAALDPLMTYATTTITNVAVDIAGLTWSSELTLDDDWCHVNFDVGAGGTLLASARDTGVDAAAAGTYQRVRVEVDADGVMRTFIAKALLSTSAAAAVDVDEEFNPQVIIESSTTAVQELLCRQFAAWGKRA